MMHRGQHNNWIASQRIYAKIAFTHGDTIPYKDRPDQTNGDICSSIYMLNHRHGDLFLSDYKLLAS